MGPDCSNQEGPRIILEKPSKIPRAFPTPVMDVHVVMEVCCAHTGDSIASNYLCALSRNWTAVYRATSYGAMSYGAMNPGIFMEKGSRLLPTAPAKEKLGWMSELQTGQRALKVRQSAVLDPGQCAMCISGQNSWVLDGRIIKRFMPSVATLRYLPTVLDMGSNLS